MTELDILKARVELLRGAHTLANGALRSAWQIADRNGRNTNWAGFREQLRMSLDASHAALNALNATPVDENACPGHIASASDPKICFLCGTHIDSLRP